MACKGAFTNTENFRFFEQLRGDKSSGEYLLSTDCVGPRVLARLVLQYWHPLQSPLKKWAGALLVAQRERIYLLMQEVRFNPWVRKIPWRRAGQPTPGFLLENPMDRGARRATVRGVTESDTTTRLSAASVVTAERKTEGT